MKLSVVLRFAITMLACLVISTSCSEKQSQTMPAAPSIQADAKAVFWYATSEIPYELADDEAKMLISLLSSTPNATYDSDEWFKYKEDAVPICEFMVDNHRYQYHGFLLYEDAHGNAFIWEHPFISDILWHPPLRPDTVADRFQKMSDYDWPTAKQ